MAAPTLAGLNQGVQKGYRQMGVVGTPCQMMAVAKMRSNLLKKEAFVDPVALAPVPSWSRSIFLKRIAVPGLMVKVAARPMTTTPSILILPFQVVSLLIT